jgi:invasion protein IalB
VSRVTLSWSVLVALLVASTTGAQETDREYQDWALRCPEKDPCVLEQRVLVKGMEQGPLVHLGFQALEQPSQLLAVLRVPLGVLLAPGLQLIVDGGEPRTIPMHHCRAQGCIALFPLTPDLRQALEAGREAQVSFHTLDGSRIGVAVSLLGITTGFKALEAAAKRDERSQRE